MGNVIGEKLSFAVGVAVSPVPIAAVIVIAVLLIGFGVSLIGDTIEILF